MGGRARAAFAEPEQTLSMGVDFRVRLLTQSLERNRLVRGILGLIVTIVVIVLVLRFMGVL